jgi:hypothetical protein
VHLFCGFRPAFFFGPTFFILIFQLAKGQLISASPGRFSHSQPDSNPFGAIKKKYGLGAFLSSPIPQSPWYWVN